MIKISEENMQDIQKFLETENIVIKVKKGEKERKIYFHALVSLINKSIWFEWKFWIWDKLDETIKDLENSSEKNKEQNLKISYHSSTLYNSSSGVLVCVSKNGIVFLKNFEGEMNAMNLFDVIENEEINNKIKFEVFKFLMIQKKNMYDFDLLLL